MLHKFHSNQSETQDRARTKPSIWDMPDSGLQWCDCGGDHQLQRDDISDIASHLSIEEDATITHQQLVILTMELWNYVEVCRFFHLRLNDAAQHIHGTIAELYPYEDGMDIVGYFSKTWQGCPEEVCAGGFDAESTPDWNDS